MRLSLVACAVAVVLANAGCYRTRTLSLAQPQPCSRALVTLDDNSSLVLNAPSVRDSQLTGWVNGVYREYPTSRVQQIQVRELSYARTTALVLVSVTALAVYVAAQPSPHTVVCNPGGGCY